MYPVLLRLFPKIDVKMLTDATFQQLAILFKIISSTKCFPLQYKSKERRFVRCSRKATILILTSLMNCIARSLFIGYSFVIGLIHRDVSTTDISLAGGFTSFYVNTRGKVNGNFSDGCSVYMKLITPTCISGSFCFALFFLLQPNSGRYFYSYISGEKRPGFILAYFIYEYYSFLCPWAQLNFYWYLTLLYANSCSFWLAQSGNVSSTNKWTKDSLRMNGSTHLKMFRSIQLLTIQFNDCFRMIIFPATKLYCMSQTVLSIYVCVKFHSEVHWVVILGYMCDATLNVVYVGITFPLLSSVCEKCKDFVKTNTMGGKEWSKILKSFPVLSVKVGSCYDIQKSTLLTYIALVLNLSANALITW